MRISIIRRQVTFAAVLAMAGLAVIVVMLLWIPAYVSFVVAVTGAVRWCIWLERNPNTELIVSEADRPGAFAGNSCSLHHGFSDGAHAALAILPASNSPPGTSTRSPL